MGADAQTFLRLSKPRKWVIDVGWILIVVELSKMAEGYAVAEWWGVLMILKKVTSDFGWVATGRVRKLERFALVIGADAKRFRDYQTPENGI
ncbi:hypothetical protein CEXT_78791 [Caerostris extrusa]|uniref:Uncharacterized protein n=1 Tax=Caerostris extrusa TaxID=172846 RepID=A0AAV4N7H9_CAEEX|nr:hypothetical protein CEXT_78791 [Caerostris extrusa]